MKRKILSWLNKTWHRNFPKRANPFAKFLWNQRMVDCAMCGLHRPGSVIWIGDSRLHQFEDQIESQPGNHLCAAVSGAKIEDIIPRIRQMIFLAKPSKIVSDMGGNNILSGQPLGRVIDKKTVLINDIQQAGIPLIETEIPPAGTEIDAAIHCNSIFAAYNIWLKKYDPVKLCDKIAPQDFLAPEYDCGDHIHFSGAAWPIIQERVGTRL